MAGAAGIDLTPCAVHGPTGWCAAADGQAHDEIARCRIGEGMSTLVCAERNGSVTTPPAHLVPKRAIAAVAVEICVPSFHRSSLPPYPGQSGAPHPGRMQLGPPEASRQGLSKIETYLHHYIRLSATKERSRKGVGRKHPDRALQRLGSTQGGRPVRECEQDLFGRLDVRPSTSAIRSRRPRFPRAKPRRRSRQ